MQDLFNSEQFDDYLKFRKMITPAIIQILFWVLAGGCALVGLIIMGTSFGRYGNGAGSFLGGLVTLLLGPIVARVYCEILILFFRMNETLTEIKNALDKK